MFPLKCIPRTSVTSPFLLFGITKGTNRGKIHSRALTQVKLLDDYIIAISYLNLFSEAPKLSSIQLWLKSPMESINPRIGMHIKLFQICFHIRSIQAPIEAKNIGV